MDHHRLPRGRAAVALLLSLGLLVAACGGGSKKADGGSSTTSSTAEPARSPVKGGELTFAMESDVATLEPGAAAQPSDKVITLGIYDPLATYEDGVIVPSLAESLTPSADLKTYEMTLRKGVTFQDGTKLDADSVVKHFVRLQADATACPCKDLVKIISSMDTPDGKTG